MSRGWPAASTPNLEDQVIFDEGFLPLALDTPVSDCRVAMLVLVRSGHSEFYRNGFLATLGSTLQEGQN